MATKQPNKSNVIEQEFGGTLGAALFTISTPATVLAILILCSEVNCPFGKTPDLSPYYSLSTWWNLDAFYLAIFYLLLVAILQILPIGGKRVKALKKEDPYVYRINSTFSFVVITSVAIFLQLRGYQLAEFVTKNIFQLYISSLILGFGLSIFVYLKSFSAPQHLLNPVAINQNIICSYFLGREINPRLFNILDFKLFVTRVTTYTALLLELAYLTRNESFWSPTEILLITIRFIYLADAIIWEEDWLSTFEFQTEGFGFMGAVGYFIYPFVVAAQTKYITEHRINLPTWRFILIIVIFTTGYILFKGSNGQKSAFRRNPRDPSVSHLKTLDTKSGKKLLISGYWGFIRHPNYLGDIMMCCSFGLFTLYTLHAVPFYLTTVLLVHRTMRDHERCKLKYGSDWDKYCRIVKYILIPKIF